MLALVLVFQVKQSWLGNNFLDAIVLAPITEPALQKWSTHAILIV